MDCVDIEIRIDELLARMSLAEKIGQMSQLNHASDGLEQAVREGRVGSVINEVGAGRVNELQRVAVTQSRLGIPLLFGRDVIHGFRTIFPIPLGLAASWNPELVSTAAGVAAAEAAAAGVNWTFAPMMDITRDPRWGRVAESLGEDPYLCKTLATAMVAGFQGDDLASPASLAACAKHYAAYGACEGGRDYNTVTLPEIELRNVYLPPFEAAVEAGVASVMTSFSELNGVPATGDEFLLRQVLRDEWGFGGLVVSDWESVSQMTVHGFAEDEREAALRAARAGVDMEMAGTCYADHLGALVAESRIAHTDIDAMVANVLRLKFRLGLFEQPYAEPGGFPPAGNPDHLAEARRAAVQCCVLLKNDADTLPLSLQPAGSIAVIGPMADEAREQLGTWVFDADPSLSQTPLAAISALAGGDVTVRYARGLENTRSNDRGGFPEAVETARACDTVIMCVGEDAILSGEAHCRASLDLPGAQQALIEAVAATGKAITLVVLAGRPLTLEQVIDKVGAVLYAWHPGSMAGPAIADLLFGRSVPSGKLPVTFPRTVGQVPLYYAHKNTGKPAGPDTWVHIDDIPEDAEQTSFGMTSMYLDAGYQPMFPFGFGLSYTEFAYTNIRVSSDTVRPGSSIQIRADVENRGDIAADEIVQLYVRDMVGSITRPVRELKGFQRIHLQPGEKQTVTFDLHTRDLAFFDRQMRRVTEPGAFSAWIGGDSEAGLGVQFTLSGQEGPDTA